MVLSYDGGTEIRGVREGHIFYVCGGVVNFYNTLGVSLSIYLSEYWGLRGAEEIISVCF